MSDKANRFVAEAGDTEFIGEEIEDLGEGKTDRQETEQGHIRERLDVLDFKDLLSKNGFDLDKVIVMRHRPTPPELRKVLPWFAAERPEVFNAYQQTQKPKAEKALMKADFLASFIGQDDKTIFVGLYQRGASRPITDEQFWAIPAVRQMKELGLAGIPDGETALWFDLKLLGFYAKWRGRLVVTWPGGQAWCRWAKTNDFAISAIHEDSLFDKPVCDWPELTLTYGELKVLPRKLRDALRQWRGIYFILDRSDGKGYVGSAFGQENIPGRWRVHAKLGGDAKQLKQRNPEDFVFSILQLTSPDLEQRKVVQLEESWMKRLHTRRFGLNGKEADDEQ